MVFFQVLHYVSLLVIELLSSAYSYTISLNDARILHQILTVAAIVTLELSYCCYKYQEKPTWGDNFGS